MNKKLLGILKHALGISQTDRAYRNHFVAGGKDVDRCQVLVLEGYMRRVVMHPELTGGDPCFTVTEKGKQAAIADKGE
jgi:hypothetical protein